MMTVYCIVLVPVLAFILCLSVFSALVISFFVWYPGKSSAYTWRQGSVASSADENKTSLAIDMPPLVASKLWMAVINKLAGNYVSIIQIIGTSGRRSF